MEDDELQQIRARRMAELRAQSGASGSSMGGLPAGMGGGKKDEDEKAKKSQMEEARRTMLLQILDGEARERLSRIAMVKADKARAVEDLLIRMGQGGQLRGKITEKQLIELLENVNQQTENKTKIVYNRRRYDDSDDDFDL
ncbi:Programmed cell death protein 5 [Lunasporangiospora selenospora]|uniref:Programmed cell death protein 5 n=1 Tax=Lunasporangiospora selenospora TaxID=979761 RepID=A0A9P6FNL1_9FUNG|nr:Programmed cell death protein 5 [Lunasporangiospora selenospora]